MESKKDERDSNSDKSSRSKISKQKACWDETQHSAPRSPGPRVPSAQPRTCWERGSPGHGSSRRGNSQVSGLASARQPGISRRAGAHWTAGAVRKQRRRSPGAPLSPLPPSGHPAAGSPGAPTRTLLRASASWLPYRGSPKGELRTRKGRTPEERKKLPIQSGSLFILKLRPEPRTPPCWRTPASCRRPRPASGHAHSALANRGAALRPRRPAADARGLDWVPRLGTPVTLRPYPPTLQRPACWRSGSRQPGQGPVRRAFPPSCRCPRLFVQSCVPECVFICLVCSTCKYRLDSLYSIYYHNYELKVTVCVTFGGDLRRTTKHLLSAGYCNKRWGHTGGRNPLVPEAYWVLEGKR